MRLIFSLSGKEEDDLDLNLDGDDEKPAKKKAPVAKSKKPKEPSLPEQVDALKKANDLHEADIDKLLEENTVSDYQFDYMDVGEPAKFNQSRLIMTVPGDGYKDPALTAICNEVLDNVGLDYPITFNPKYVEYWDQIKHDDPTTKMLMFLEYMHGHGMHPEKPKTSLTNLYSSLMSNKLSDLFKQINKHIKPLRVQSIFKTYQTKYTQIGKNRFVATYILVPVSAKRNVLQSVEDMGGAWYDRMLPVAYTKFTKLNQALSDNMITSGRWYILRKEKDFSICSRTASKPESMLLRIDITLPEYGLKIEEGSVRLNMFKKYCKQYSNI